MKKTLFPFVLTLLVLAGCDGKRGNSSANPAGNTPATDVPVFQADSALSSIIRQCSFGPRVTGTESHARCGEYIANTFSALGYDVTKQNATFTRYDGVKMDGYNIIARSLSKQPKRLLIAAHWDSRPWADQDVSETNLHKPIPGANDGASGVAVMLELARVLSLHPDSALPAVDFICFDAEDCGTPEWEERGEDHESTWCLGSQFWSKQPHRTDYAYGILLDMVGGRGARFYREGYSMQFAAQVVERVWNAARQAGYSDYFPRDDSGYITDDHLFVNRLARIPMIDIVPYHPIGDSSFGPTWHTLQDAPENIDPATLRAVGQTLLQLIYTETD